VRPPDARMIENEVAALGIHEFCTG
jgi:hypothetical protein